LLDGNLYIGTSAGEVIHHVEIPPDPEDPSSQSAFIQASRLQPRINQHTGTGIQQILLLPSINKACILSNNTLNFYSLPELSPAFPQLKPLTCGWVGGVDLDAENGQAEGQNGVVIMMCLRNKIRLVKIGAEQPSKIRDIEFGGCLATVRRGDFACVADARSYALLDVVHQQKIPLTSISTVDDQPAEQVGTGTLADEVWPGSTSVSRSSSSAGTAANRLAVQERGHTRASSLGVFRTDHAQLGQDLSRPPSTTQRHGFDVPASMQRTASPSQRPPVSPERRGSEGARSASLSKPLPAPPIEPTSSQASAQPSPTKTYVPLKPIIASPTPSEFLIVNGTAPSEPGVGMFVNVDGEGVRGSMEFSSYPIALVVDGKGIDLSTSQAETDVQEEGFVLAVVRRDQGLDIEIQRWDVDPGEGSATKEWLGVTSRTHGVSADIVKASKTLGIRSMVENVDISLPEITSKLALKVIHLSGSLGESNPDSQAKREKEEAGFIGRLCKTDAHIALWVSNEVYWMIRNPMVLKLDARLRLAQATSIEKDAPIEPQRELIEVLINDIRGLKSQTELEFFTLAYIRQKAAMLLFMDLVLRTIAGTIVFEHDKRSTEEILLESELDPRFLLAFLTETTGEVLQGPDGVCVQ
jgi:hypothetical protein